MIRRVFIKFLLLGAASFSVFKLFFSQTPSPKKLSSEELFKGFEDLSSVLLGEKVSSSTIKETWEILEKTIPKSPSLENLLGNYPLSKNTEVKRKFINKNQKICQELLILLYTGKNSSLGIKLSSKSYLQSEIWPLIRSTPLGLPAGQTWDKKRI